MKWKKLGKIFNPSDYKINEKTIEFAQSPQALCFDSHIRVYFSHRIKDNKEKYISKIAYVDFTPDFKEILDVSQNEVIADGALGCYDEHGIFPLNVCKFQNKILGFIGGWNRRVSVMIDGAIGLSESFDNGETFLRLGNGPILGPTLNEPFLVADPFVKEYDKKLHMWYIFGEKWVTCEKYNQPERIYKIGHASSSNGIDWLRDGKFIIEDSYLNNECQALPTVVKIDSKFHMYFCFRYATDFRNKDRGYRLGHAYSEDLKTWKRDDTTLNIYPSDNQEDWDSEMICYPHTFEFSGKIFMLYNGNAFGKNGFGLAELIN
jgi:hypothetical protein